MPVEMPGGDDPSGLGARARSRVSVFSEASGWERGTRKIFKPRGVKVGGVRPLVTEVALLRQGAGTCLVLCGSPEAPCFPVRGGRT